MTNTPSPDEDRELIERLWFVGYLNSDNGDYGLRNPDGPKAADRLESLRSDRAKLEEANAKLRRCLLPVQMTLAQAECVDEPIPDDVVVLHFMGSGASDQVTAGEVRAALNWSTDHTP